MIFFRNVWFQIAMENEHMIGETRRLSSLVCQVEMEYSILWSPFSWENVFEIMMMKAQ